MGKRRQQRVKTVIPVRITGVDQTGKPFAELVHTLDISYAGARLGGAQTGMVPGSIVSVQCRLRKSQFTVAWVAGTQSAFKGQVGLRNLEPQRDIFGASLKDELCVDDYVANEASPLPAAGRPAAAAPAPNAGLAARLEKVTAELDTMDKAMQSGAVNPEVLADFRDAVSRVRTTAWALQQWMDLEQGQKNPTAVLSYLNAERIAVAIRLCESLYLDLQKADVGHQREQLQVLLTSVEKLFTRLAAMDLSVLETSAEGGAEQPKKPRSVGGA